MLKRERKGVPWTLDQIERAQQVLTDVRRILTVDEAEYSSPHADHRFYLAVTQVVLYGPLREAENELSRASSALRFGEERRISQETAAFVRRFRTHGAIELKDFALHKEYALTQRREAERAQGQPPD